MRCDKCGWHRPKHAVCEFDDTLTEPYESCLNWKPITNADHIRAMTDEEMVDFFCDMQRRTRYHALTWNEVIEWLQEEAQVD